MAAMLTVGRDKVCVVIMFTVPYHRHIAFKMPTTTDLACSNKWKLILVIFKRTYTNQTRENNFCVFHSFHLFCFDSRLLCVLCVCVLTFLHFFLFCFGSSPSYSVSYGYHHRYCYQLSAMKAPPNSYRM